MFGRRSDGRLVKGVDPIVMFTPYIMPKRDDAQVFTKQELDFEVMTNYIREKRKAGHNITYMSMIIAAYVRTLCDFPDLNRFIMNKKLYARNHICVSFVTLKKNADDTVEESLVKVEFQQTDTIFDISERLEAAIAKSREPKDVNKTDKVARTLLSIPLLPDIVVGLVRLLDRYGLVPAYLHNASPFHTSLFISNMASIGMGYIYHHIYNFGTTSIFLGMGKTEQKVHANADGTCSWKRVMPIGAVIDERICSGGVYTRAFSCVKSYLNHPERLETPPDHIYTEVSMREAAEAQHQLNA